MTLPTEANARKEIPIGTGVLDYFPLAIAGIARVSFEGNKQHNPGEPLHWAKEKSTDESDAMMRHFLQRYEKDSDGTDHAAKMCWRALAFYQRLLDERKPKTLKKATVKYLEDANKEINRIRFAPDLDTRHPSFKDIDPSENKP